MTDQTIVKRIENEISHNPVVLYMQGSPMYPRCGFSAAVVQILSVLDVNFKSVDVLTDRSLYDGIQKYTNFPRLPQLFIAGTFVGDGHEVRQLYQSGKLQDILDQNGIAYKG